MSLCEQCCGSNCKCGCHENGKSEWISVTDRLPDHLEHVMLIWADGQYHKDGIWYDNHAKGWMEDGPSPDGWGPCKRNVTHWMLLPEPPHD